MDESAWIKILEQSDKKDLLILIQKMADISSESENLLIEYCKQKADTHQKELLYERQLQIKWNSIDSIIDDANEYGGCPQEDEDLVYDTLYDMQEIVKTHKTAWDTRKSIADEMLEQANYGNSGFDDILFEQYRNFAKKNQKKNIWQNF